MTNFFLKTINRTQVTLAKLILEEEKAIAHDFTSKVVSESGEQELPFQYQSGWFLEGLGEGEIE